MFFSKGSIHHQPPLGNVNVFMQLQGNAINTEELQVALEFVVVDIYSNLKKVV